MPEGGNAATIQPLNGSPPDGNTIIVFVTRRTP
jgi:hypothetical protein